MPKNVVNVYAMHYSDIVNEVTKNIKFLKDLSMIATFGTWFCVSNVCDSDTA